MGLGLMAWACGLWPGPVAWACLALGLCSFGPVARALGLSLGPVAMALGLSLWPGLVAWACGLDLRPGPVP